MSRTTDPQNHSHEWQWRAIEAQAAAAAAQAHARLLGLAETQDSGQIRRVAGFLASTFDGQTFPLDPFELHALDIAISDDRLACLDTLHWGKADLHKRVPNGERRVLAVCAAWGLKWPQVG